jgi:hypothetical protein
METQLIIVNAGFINFSWNVLLKHSWLGMVAAEIGLFNENNGVLQKLLQLYVCSRADKTE